MNTRTLFPEMAPRKAPPPSEEVLKAERVKSTSNARSVVRAVQLEWHGLGRSLLDDEAVSLYVAANGSLVAEMAEVANEVSCHDLLRQLGNPTRTSLAYWWLRREAPDRAEQWMRPLKGVRLGSWFGGKEPVWRIKETDAFYGLWMAFLKFGKMTERAGRPNDGRRRDAAEKLTDRQQLVIWDRSIGAALDGKQMRGLPLRNDLNLRTLDFSFVPSARPLCRGIR